ncbi:MAG TPA: EI24 domain-containing protein, partial [bacterium]|nr:EI24 domain-containing protein [bacterium]
MSNEGSEPKVKPEEESIFNRPRPKLKLAPLKHKQDSPENDRKSSDTVEESEKEKKVESEKVKYFEQKKIEKIEKEKELQKDKEEELRKKQEEKEEKIRKRLERKRNRPPLISLKETIRYIAGNGKLSVFSLATALIMIFISIFLYHMIFSFINGLAAPFYSIPPMIEEFHHYFYFAGWAVFKFFFKASVTIFIFYITFMIAYLISSPLYSFISFVSENIFKGNTAEEDNEFILDYVAEDILQGLKMTAVALSVTVYLFFINFIPVIGQIMVFVSYILLNTILIIDFTATRKEWNFVSRILWMKDNPLITLLIGGSLTFVAIIPLANNILAAFLIPFLVVY